ncbi:unnamed protein product, partial [Rhizoctonia solani]
KYVHDIRASILPPLFVKELLSTYRSTYYPWTLLFPKLNIPPQFLSSNDCHQEYCRRRKVNFKFYSIGGAGVPLVQALQKHINSATHQIVVIEKRDYFAHWPALVRAAVTDDGSIDERGLVPNDRVFDSTIKVVRSNIKQITPAEVITESDEVVPYEHLVLATGSIWTGPLALPDKRDDAVQHFKSFKKQLAAAEHILIVGGGSVGLEYAGEIQHYYPDKKVVIIHGGSELMNKTYPIKFRRSLLDAVTKKGAQVIFGDKISPDVVPQDGYVTTQSGKRIRADLVIPAAGGRPNTGVVSTLDVDVVTKTGTVLVTPELRVKLSSGAQNVWAIGDIIEWPEQKAHGFQSRVRTCAHSNEEHSGQHPRRERSTIHRQARDDLCNSWAQRRSWAGTVLWRDCFGRLSSEHDEVVWTVCG